MNQAIGNSFKIQVLIFPQPPFCQGEFRFLVIFLPMLRFVPVWYIRAGVNSAPCAHVFAGPIRAEKLLTQRAQRTQRKEEKHEAQECSALALLCAPLCPLC